jgi:uncharacterized Zn finger protein
MAVQLCYECDGPVLWEDPVWRCTECGRVWVWALVMLPDGSILQAMDDIEESEKRRERIEQTTNQDGPSPSH